MQHEAENFIKGLYVVQESNTGRKTDCSKSSCHATLLLLFFSTVRKINSPVKNLSLFEQGTMSTVIT